MGSKHPHFQVEVKKLTVVVTLEFTRRLVLVIRLPTETRSYSLQLCREGARLYVISRGTDDRSWGPGSSLDAKTAQHHFRRDIKVDCSPTERVRRRNRLVLYLPGVWVC